MPQITENMEVYRYFIYLSYDGANYHGWQIQPNGISVQESLMKALKTFLRCDIDIMGAGRTDAGVHAKMMIAHFDFSEHLDVVSVADKLNKILPPDIAVFKVVEVKPDAHARFDAIARTYQYYVTTQKSPFMRDYSYRLYQDIDMDKMNAAARILFDYKDFTSFSKLHTDVKTNLCEIMEAQWSKEDEYTFVFTIKANRFLRNMVRAIVGTLLEVGKGKMSLDEFRQVIEAKNRGVAGASVPGKALFLVQVDYPDDIFKTNK